MTLFRITNALCGVLAALWWLLNRQSDMAEPIVAIIGCSLVLIEIAGEVIAGKSKSQRESQAAIENEILANVLDRIEREENNIQQVIDGRRKQDKIIEEYPIELIEPHVLNLKKLDRFSRLAERLQVELDRNKTLPAGQKHFDELKAVLDEIKSLANSPCGRRTDWLCRSYLYVAICVGVYGVVAVRLPSLDEDATQIEEPSAFVPKAGDSDAPQGNE